MEDYITALARFNSEQVRRYNVEEEYQTERHGLRVLLDETRTASELHYGED